MKPKSYFDDYTPGTVPWLQSLAGVVKFVKNPLPVIDDAVNSYGPTYYTRIVGGRKIVMTLDPDVVQHVLQKNNKNYAKSELQTESFGKYIGNGLLTANGEYWLRQRRLIQPGFYKAKIAGLVDTMYAEVRDHVHRIREKVERGNDIIDVGAEMMELTLRVVSKSLFTTGISNEQISDLGVKFTAVQEHIIKEVRQPVMNWWRHLNGEMKAAKEMSEAVKDILRSIIAERRNHPQNVDDLLDMLLHSTYEDTGEQMTDEQILDEALIIFTAGHETTANTLTWCLYLLAQHGHIVDSIRDEYDKVKHHGLDMQSLMQSEYSQMVSSEAMRLYPPAWILDRVALEDDQIKNVRINKGDLVGLYVYGTHRSEAIWSDAKQFIPERFAREEIKKHHAYAYYPFGGGPRLCIGNHFAMMEMLMALFAFLDQFDLELLSEPSVDVQPMITLRPDRAIQLKLTIRP